LTEILEILETVHKILEEIPIIFTFRNLKEGGERDIDFETYANYCTCVAEKAEKYNVAFIDVELYGKKDEEGIRKLVDDLHAQNVKIIGSNHHFDKTPSEEEMITILSEMENMGADVCKLAVMPEEKTDVDRLISASKKADKKLKAPVITMSMGELGAVTRVCTRLTGSVLTFATATEASAPGQLKCNVVRELLKTGNGCEMDCNIVLIGFMGTGKTTISKALSRITGFHEIDVDHYIVKKAGMEISDIFEKNGEEYFRTLETQALREIQKGKGQIISCGGGAVLKDENVEILKKGGVIVLLTATPETIFERVKDHTHRPILNNDMSLNHVKELMEAREPRYQSVADIKVNVDSNDRVMTCYDMLKQLEKGGYLK
jgi:3-dehydroquinate dehydratase type I